jgi:hypothetical protein
VSKFTHGVKGIFDDPTKQKEARNALCACIELQSQTTCELCGGDVPGQPYDTGDCAQCGQPYVYDEGFGIVLTEAQLIVLRLHSLLPLEPTKDG